MKHWHLALIAAAWASAATGAHAADLSTKAAAFTALQALMAEARSTDLYGGTLSYTLSGDACRPDFRERHGDSGLDTASDSAYQLDFANTEDVEVDTLVVPMLSFGDDDGPTDILFVLAEDADAAADAVRALVELCSRR